MEFKFYFYSKACRVFEMMAALAEQRRRKEKIRLRAMAPLSVANETHSTTATLPTSQYYRPFSPPFFTTKINTGPQSNLRRPKYGPQHNH